MSVNKRKDENYTDNDKLQFEVQKLQLEIDSLQRPWKNNHNYIIAVATAFFGILAVLLQYYKSDFEYQLVEIKKEKLILETEKLNTEKDRIGKIVIHEKDRLDELEKLKMEAVAKIERTNKEFEILKQALAKYDQNFNKNENFLHDEKYTVEKLVASINDTQSTLSELPYVLSTIAYIGGEFMMVSGALSLKIHAENPASEPQGKGIARLLTGGKITAVPALTGVDKDDKQQSVNEENQK